MTHIAVLGSTNMDLVAYVAKAPPQAIAAARAGAIASIGSTGAGDTFVGALAVALAEHRPTRDVLAWAHAS